MIESAVPAPSLPSLKDGKTVRVGNTSFWLVITEEFDAQMADLAGNKHGGYTWCPESDRVLASMTLCRYENGKLVKTDAGRCWTPQRS